MINAIIFDLDGTLIQSERMKAQSYAIAVQRLRGLDAPDVRAIEAYREIVGASRHEASRYVMEKLGLEADLAAIAEAYGVSEPWEAFSAMRVEIYNGMVEDPEVIRTNQWSNTTGLLRVARDSYAAVALATMSLRDEALRVLRILELEGALDLVLTREDVTHPKPDPEIYTLAATRLQVEPRECIVLEDSAHGVHAALAAGMTVVAIATPFTWAGLHASSLIDDCWIVHEPDALLEVVARLVAEKNGEEA